MIRRRSALPLLIALPLATGLASAKKDTLVLAMTRGAGLSTPLTADLCQRSVAAALGLKM